MLTIRLPSRKESSTYCLTLRTLRIPTWNIDSTLSIALMWRRAWPFVYSEPVQ